MRTAIIIAAGLVLWAICMIVAKNLPNSGPSTLTAATASFVGVWILIAAANMWMGVARAGYSFREELPIFLLIALLPALVAIVARWKLL